MKNGNFTFQILLEFILADQLADLPPPTSAVHHGMYIIGMYLAAIVDSSRKGGNLLLFLNN